MSGQAVQEITGTVRGTDRAGSAFEVSATDGTRTLAGTAGTYDRAHELLAGLMDQLRPASWTR